MGQRISHSASGPEMYLAMRQTKDYAAMQLVVRTALPPDSLAAGIRTALRPIDPNLPVRDFQTFQDLVDKAVSPRRFLALLLGGFAAFALVLASLGIYALISYSVSQRVQEIGIRMALGASASEILRMVIGNGLRLALAGVVIGLAASFVLTRLTTSLLFETSATDPTTFVGSALLFVAVAALASYIPARRATRINATEALRAG